MPDWLNKNALACDWAVKKQAEFQVPGLGFKREKEKGAWGEKLEKGVTIRQDGDEHVLEGQTDKAEAIQESSDWQVTGFYLGVKVLKVLGAAIAQNLPSILLTA